MKIRNADRIWIIGKIENDIIDPLKVYPSSSFQDEEVEKPIVSKGYDERDTKRAIWESARDRKVRLVVAYNVKINDDLIIPRELLGELPEEVPINEICGEVV